QEALIFHTPGRGRPFGAGRRIGVRPSIHAWPAVTARFAPAPELFLPKGALLLRQRRPSRLPLCPPGPPRRLFRGSRRQASLAAGMPVLHHRLALGALLRCQRNARPAPRSPALALLLPDQLLPPFRGGQHRPA